MRAWACLMEACTGKTKEYDCASEKSNSSKNKKHYCALEGTFWGDRLP